MRRIRTNYVRTVLIFAVLFLLSACKAELWDASQGPQEVALCASTAQTRTEMLSNGLSATWKSDDEIAVWAKNSSGSFVFSNQTFGVYGSGDGHGYFTSTLQSSMADGTYTYLCCYPKPESVTGTKVTFTLPAEQDGKVSGGADIMIADPVKHGPLATVSEIEDGNGLSMKMNRMMHQFRFYIPEEVTALGGKEIIYIEATMPNDIVGTFSADLETPSSVISVSKGSKTISLNLKDPLGVSKSLDEAEFACAAVFPYIKEYSSADYMNITVYTSDGRAVLEPISLAGRTFDAGHSTPVKLLPEEVMKYARITFTVGDNNLGEVLSNIYIKSGEKVLYTYSNSSGKYDNIYHIEHFEGDTRVEAYHAIVKAIEDGTAVINFDSEHASLDVPLKAEMMTRNGVMANLDLGDIPYLFFEDFSQISTFSSNDEYSSTFNSGSKSAISFLTGWSGARVGAEEGTAIRIAARRETSADYPARVDSAPLYGIKAGCKVNIRVEYNYSAAYEGKQVGQTILQGYVTNLSSIKSPDSIYKLFSGQDFSKIEGTFAANDRFEINENTGSYNNIPNIRSYQINGIERGTRLSWASVNKHQAGANNTTLWFYIDNIKVQIVK